MLAGGSQCTLLAPRAFEWDLVQEDGIVGALAIRNIVLYALREVLKLGPLWLYSRMKLLSVINLKLT